MKHLLISMTAMLFVNAASGCSKDDDAVSNETISTNTNPNTNNSSNKMKITVGSSVFTASFYDNVTANAFKAMLPLTINMNELNDNEKYYDFSTSLPTNSSNPGSVQNGDIMLYGNKTLVLFYQSFSTSYSYSRIGKIDDASGLAAALGSGNVSVKFELN